MSNCCHTPDITQPAGHSHEGYDPRKDILLLGMLGVIVTGFILHFSGWHPTYLGTFAHAVVKLMSVMWWGIAGGIIAVGIMSRIPRSYFQVIMGRGDTVGGVIRATLAGVLLDLCSHGILMVGAKLYERGASLAQVMAFLIASPWNSITLTLILVSLIGVPWTLTFIACSALIAITTGIVYLQLVKREILPANPFTASPEPEFDIKADFKIRLSQLKITPALLWSILKQGFFESLPVMRWLFFGVVLAALIQTFISDQAMTTWFGPTLIGLLLTLLATTVIEVCSEGSTPVGADLVTRAGAPGNGFTFLMAGVSTDYTEMLVLRQTTKSWKIALSLPLLTVPQVVLLGWLMNHF
ncbi:MAG: permease [Alphaproteobacteria bacterium]|nr:permease [Alphaproteobacteria bacterium]